MNRYKSIFSEQEEEKESNIDSRISAFIKTLRDEDFGNESQRKKMIDILTSAYNSTDPRARLLFKKIGSHLTEIGDEILKYGQE